MKDAAKVNLIPFNPFPGTRFERSDEDDIRAFQKLLLDAQRADHGAPHARRRHRRRLRPAQGPGAWTAPAARPSSASTWRRKGSTMRDAGA